MLTDPDPPDVVDQQLPAHRQRPFPPTTICWHQSLVVATRGNVGSAHRIP